MSEILIPFDRASAKAGIARTAIYAGIAAGTLPKPVKAGKRSLWEAALAHVVEDKTEAAYRRGALLEKRRKLMEAWAAWCEKESRASQPPVLP